MNDNEETTASVPTYVSLCSGYDGIGIGLKRAIPGLRTIAHVEIETYAIANLISKMEAGQVDACPVFTDLKQFPYEQLRDRVTVLSAGFPCQPFSSAGKRKATEDERHLYPYIADGITAMRPRYVFLENVQGIISAKTADGESVLKYVLGDLEERGYSCTWGVFSAEEVGAPHQRKRVFILGKLSNASCEGLQRNELGASCDEQVEGIQGTYESTTKLHQVRDGQVGNASSLRPHRGSENCEGEQSEVLGERLESDELANPTNRRGKPSKREGGQSAERGSTDRGGDSREGQDTSGGSEDTQWPARPGEEQYEWEEPRVTEAIGKLGGATNGTQHRVDRLRLLGNGVVPDCCELAWQVLSNRLHQQT